MGNFLNTAVGSPVRGLFEGIKGGKKTIRTRKKKIKKKALSQKTKKRPQ